jgi:hypothetical protein
LLPKAKTCFVQREYLSRVVGFGPLLHNISSKYGIGKKPAALDDPLGLQNPQKVKKFNFLLFWGAWAILFSLTFYKKWASAHFFIFGVKK